MLKKSFWLLAILCLLNLSIQSLAAHQSDSSSGSEAEYLPIVSSRSFEFIASSSTFDKTTDIASAGDERLFIVEQEGRIKVVQASGDVSIFLDITDRVYLELAEEGLLAVTFALDYEESGWFYVAYINEEITDEHWLIVSAFKVSADPSVANASSEVQLLRVKQDNPIHNGGGLIINPNDGHLYVGVGDDAQTTLAQSSTSNKGKLLRVELAGVDLNASLPLHPSLDGFAAVSTTIWASGLRNPWQLAIHPTTNDIFIGDVGSNVYEEINFIPSGTGGFNFGWPCMEGPDVRSMDPPCESASSYELPIYYYGRSQGCAVIAGEIYEERLFIFGDYCRREIYSMENVGGSWQVNLLGTLPSWVRFLTTFGVDNVGQIYAGSAGVTIPTPYYRLYIP